MGGHGRRKDRAGTGKPSRRRPAGRTGHVVVRPGPIIGQVWPSWQVALHVARRVLVVMEPVFRHERHAVAAGRALAVDLGLEAPRVEDPTGGRVVWPLPSDRAP